MYLGRADRQVKINGFRIELGEIEAALASFPGVAQTCVTTHVGSDGSARLAAYFVSGEPFETKTLNDFLGTRLPAHMRPAFYTRLDALPMTGNGKIDRAALPSPVAVAASVTADIRIFGGGEGCCRVATGTRLRKACAGR